MKKQLKRGLSMLLMVVMLMSLLPAEVIAASVEELTTTEEPSPSPTEVVPNDEGEPSGEPSEEQTEEPTAEPSEEPSAEPTEVSTEEPTEAPTEEPSSVPEESAEPTTDVTEDGSNTPAEDRAPDEGDEEGEQPGENMNPMIVESSSKATINADGTVDYSLDLTSVPKGVWVWIAVVATNGFTDTDLTTDASSFVNYDTTLNNVTKRQKGKFPIWYGAFKFGANETYEQHTLTQDRMELQMIPGSYYSDLAAAKKNANADVTYVGELTYKVYIATNAEQSGHANYYSFDAEIKPEGIELTIEPQVQTKYKSEITKTVTYTYNVTVPSTVTSITITDIQFSAKAKSVTKESLAEDSKVNGSLNTVMTTGAVKKNAVLEGGKTHTFRWQFKGNSTKTNAAYTGYIIEDDENWSKMQNTIVEAQIFYSESEKPLVVSLIFEDDSVAIEPIDIYIEAGTAKNSIKEKPVATGPYKFTIGNVVLTPKTSPTDTNVTLTAKDTLGKDAFMFDIDATEQLTEKKLTYTYDVSMTDGSKQYSSELEVNVYVIPVAELAITPNPIEISGNDSVGTGKYQKKFKVVNNGYGDALIDEVVLDGLASDTSSGGASNAAEIRNKLKGKIIPAGKSSDDVDGLKDLYYEFDDTEGLETYAGTDRISIIYSNASNLPQANMGEFIHDPATAPVNIRLSRPVLQGDPIDNVVLKAANSFTATQTVAVRNIGRVGAGQSDAGDNNDDGNDMFGVTRYRHIEILQTTAGGNTLKWTSGTGTNAKNQPNDIDTNAQAMFTTKTNKDIFITTEGLYAPIVNGVSAGSKYNFTFTAKGLSALSASDAENGVLAEGVLRIGYGEQDGSAEYTFDIPITIKFEAPSTTSATVTVKKDGNNWTSAQDGFAAPTKVVLTTTNVADGAVPTAAADAKVGDLSSNPTTIGDLSLSTTYNVYVDGGGSWKKLGTLTSGNSATATNHTINYYAAVATLTKGATITTLQSTITKPTDGNGNSLLQGTVTDGISWLFGTVGTPSSGAFGSVKYTITKDAGETITRKSINGATATTPNDTTVSATATYTLAMPEKRATVEYEATTTTYAYTLNIKKDDKAWAPTTVTLSDGTSNVTLNKPSTGKYTATLYHGKTYTLTIAAGNGTTGPTAAYTKPVPTSTNEETLAFFTINLAGSKAKVGFADAPTATSASQVVPEFVGGVAAPSTPTVVNIYSDYSDPNYTSFVGWEKTAGASGVGTIANDSANDTTYTLGTLGNETGAVTLTATYSQSHFNAALTLKLNGQVVSATNSDITGVKIGTLSGSAFEDSGVTVTAGSTWTANNVKTGNYVFQVSAANGLTYYSGTVNATTTSATLNLYTVEVANGAGNDDSNKPQITAISSVTPAPTAASIALQKVIVPVGAQLTLAPNNKAGYTPTTNWTKKIGSTNGTNSGNTYTIDATDAGKCTGGNGVVLTPTYTWAVTITTTHGTTLTDVTEVKLSKGSETSPSVTATKKTGTNGTYEVSGLDTSATYTVWVNGFKSSVTATQANAGTTVNVKLYKVTADEQCVTTNTTTLTAVTYNYGANLDAHIGTTHNAAVGSATEAYIPQGAKSGTLNLSATNNEPARYTRHTTAWIINNGTDKTTAVSHGTISGNAYTPPTSGNGMGQDITITANFIPSWKITIGTPVRPGPVTANPEPTVALSVDSKMLNKGGSTYVQIATATGTSKAFAVGASVTVSGASNAYLAAGTWDKTIFGTSGSNYTTTEDKTITPTVYLKPTLSGNVVTYDIGPGKTLPTKDHDWNKNDADNVTAIKYKKQGTSSWTTLQAGEYTFNETSTGSGVYYSLVFDDAFIRGFDVNKTGTTYDLIFESTTNGTTTNLETTFIVKSTPLVLQKVDIKEGSATPATHVAVDGKVTYDSHLPTTIDKDNKLTWEWYYTPSAVTQTNTTTALTSVTLPTSSKKLTTAAAISADGRTLDLSKLSAAEQTAVQGNNIFAVVTASVTGEGKVITNGIPVDYKANVTVKVNGTAITSNGASDSDYTVQLVRTGGTADSRTIAMKFDTASKKFVIADDNVYLYGGATYKAQANTVQRETTTFVDGNGSVISGTAQSTDVNYYLVTIKPVSVSNGKYNGNGLGTVTGSNTSAFFMDGTTDTTRNPITATTGSVTKYGSNSSDIAFAVLHGQKVDFSFAAWTKDYVMAYSGAGTTTGGSDPTTAATASIASLTSAATVGGTLTLNLYDVEAYVQGSGALNEITMKLTDGGKDYTFTTKTGTGKILGTASSANSVAAGSSATFKLPKGSYTATGVVNNATTLKGYRVPHNATTTAALTSTGATETVAVNGAANYDISIVQTGLTLEAADSYSPTNDSTSVTNNGAARAAYMPGNTTKVTNGDFTREVHLPYMFGSAVTIPLTLTNSASTDKITGISIAQTTPTGAPTVSIEALADAEKTLAIGDSVTKNITIAADATGTVEPGTYNVVFKVSYDTPETNDPTVTYTLKIIVEQVEITGVTAANGTTNAPTNAKVGETLSYSAYTADAYTSGISTKVFNTPYTIDTPNNLPLRAGTDFTYQWYRSTNNTWESTDTKIGTNATYTVAAADAGSYLFLQITITAASGKRAFGNAVAGPFTVGYDADIVVNVDGARITTAEAAANYTVALHPSGAADASTDIKLTFKGSGVFTTQTGSGSNWANSGVLTRGTTYHIVVKNGTYTGASTVVLPSEYDITFGSPATKTVNYYTVKFNTDATLANNKAGTSNATIVTDKTLQFTGNKIPAALTAKIEGATAAEDVAIAHSNTVLKDTKVTFVYNTDVNNGTAGHQWNDDNFRVYYNLSVTESVAMPTSISANTPTLTGTKTYSDVVGTVAATLTQQTFDVKFGVQGSGSISSAELWVKDSTATNQKIKTGKADAPNGFVSFGSLPAGTYTVSATPAAGSTITSYTSNGTTANVPTATSKDVSITRETVADEFYVTLVASTYTLRWYDDNTKTTASTAITASNRYNLKSGDFTYGYTAVDTTTRYLYNVGNTEVKNLKVAAASDAGNVTVTYFEKDGTTKINMSTGVAVLKPGEYIIAEITPVTEKAVNASNSPYTAQLNVTANKGGSATGSINEADRPSYFVQYAVQPAVIHEYNLSTIDAPATGVNLDKSADTNGVTIVVRDRTGVAVGNALTKLGDITWDPNVTAAAAGTVYTVTVTATANNNYVFAPTTDADVSYTLNGKTGGLTPVTAKVTDDRTLTLTYTFPATQPNSMTVTANATGGYTATAKIEVPMATKVSQDIYYVVTTKSYTLGNGAGELTNEMIRNAATTAITEQVKHGSALNGATANYDTASKKWVWDINLDDLTPGTQYYIYATSRNTGTTANGVSAGDDFKTWYRVEVQVEADVAVPTGMKILTPAVPTSPQHSNDNGKNVVYVASGSTPIKVTAPDGYNFVGWEIKTTDPVGAGTFGNNKLLETTFTPTANSTVVARFGGVAKLAATGREQFKTVPSNYTPADVHIFEDAVVTNIGTGATRGPVGFVIINEGDPTAVTPEKAAQLVAGGNATAEPTSSAEAKFVIHMPQGTSLGAKGLLQTEGSTLAVGGTIGSATDEDLKFHTHPNGSIEDGNIVIGANKATIYFYDTKDFTVIAKQDIGLTVAEASKPTLFPDERTYDLYKGKTEAPWNVGLTWGTAYSTDDRAFTITVTSNVPADRSKLGNIGLDSGNKLLEDTHYTYAAGSVVNESATGTISMDKFIDAVKDTARKGDVYTFTVTLTAGTGTATSTLKLTFDDTTPHLKTAAIDTVQRAKGADVDVKVTYDPAYGNYGTTTSSKTSYQWYRIDASSVTASWGKKDNPHEVDAIWTWTGAGDKIVGANEATYEVGDADVGKYIFAVAIGDEDGDYVRHGAVSNVVYITPTLTVQVEDNDTSYGKVQLDSNGYKLTDTKVTNKANVTAKENVAGTHLFTHWSFDEPDNVTAPTLDPVNKTYATAAITNLTIKGDVTATAHFDKLPTITPPSATFDLATDATKAYNYTANDGSGNILVTIEGTFRAGSDAATGAVSGEYTLYTTTTGTDATRTETFAKAWVEANLIVGNSYTIHVYDMGKGAKAATNGNAAYDVSATLTVSISVYRVRAFAVESTNRTYVTNRGTVKVASATPGATSEGTSNNSTLKLVAAPATGYVFVQWEIVDKGLKSNSEVNGTAKGTDYGQFGTAATSTALSPDFTAKYAETTVRALFKPGDFNPSTTAGEVRYADNKFTKTPTVKPNGITGQTFTYALADNPTWLQIDPNTGVVSITDAAVGVNVKSLNGSGTDVNNEVQVKVDVTCVQTGETKTVDLVIDVQPSPLSIKQGAGGAKYNGSKISGKPVVRDTITGVESVNDIAGTSLWTPKSTGGWDSVNDVQWSNPAQLAYGTNSYTFTANWNPANKDEKYNYTPASITLDISVTAADNELRFNDAAKGGTVTNSGYEINKEHNDKSSYNNTVYLDAVKEYDVYLKNTMKTKLYGVKVEIDPTNAIDGEQPFITNAESLNVGDLLGEEVKQFLLEPNPAYEFNAVSTHKIKLTATGYTDSTDRTPEAEVTATYELTYYVDRRPIPEVEISDLSFPIGTFTDVNEPNPEFTETTGGGMVYKVGVASGGLELVDSITKWRTKNADGAVKDKYGKTPYSVEYTKDASGKFTAKLVADENYEFVPFTPTVDGENKFSNNYTIKTNGNVKKDPKAIKTVEVISEDKSNDTLTFVVDKIKLDTVRAWSNRPSQGDKRDQVKPYIQGAPLGYDIIKDDGVITYGVSYKWYDATGTEMGEDDEFKPNADYFIEVYLTRSSDEGEWVADADVKAFFNDGKLTNMDAFGTTTSEGALHKTEGTTKTSTLRYKFHIAGSTPPPVAPSTTYYEVNYIIVPGGNTPDPTTELVAAGGYPEHVPHVTPNNNDEYQFIGWMRDDPTGKEIKEIVPNLLVKPEMVKINQDTDFYAVYGLREIKVTYDLGSFGETTDPTQEIVAKYAYPSFAPDVTIVDQYKNLARFVGWSIEKPDHALVVNLVDPLTTQIINDTVFYAVYEIDEYNYHEHYMIGYPNGEFRPEGKITRAEVATIIARAVLPDFIEFNDYGDGGYSDVAGHWAQSAIAFCSNTGVFVGYEDGTFRPDRPITREEYALVIARIQGLTDCEDRFVMPFKDVEEVSGWALDGVYTCYDEGWIDGYEDVNELGTYDFRPHRDIARAEAAKILNGYLNRGVNEAGVSSISEYIQFPDVPKWYWGYWEVAEAVNDHYYYYYLENEDGKDVPPEEWIVEAGYLNVKLDENDPDNTKNVRRSDPVYVNAN